MKILGTVPRLLAAAAVAASMFTAGAAHAQTTPQSGDLIKLSDDGDLETAVDAALYYLGADNKRYVFPNEKTYFTWYQNFDAVKVVTASQMASFAIGGNVTYRPGVRMVKIQTDPKTYAVTRNGILRWVKTESVAAALYGTNWNTKIDDVSDANFVDYRMGADLDTGDLYTAARATGFATSINADKLLISTPANLVDLRNSGFVPSTLSVGQGTTVSWINLSTNAGRVASNPHPTHTGLPGFDSPTLELGQEYDFTFSTQGTFGYHNHWTPSQTGQVVVGP